MADEQECTEYCPHFQHAIEVIGRRWSGSIVRLLADRSYRFAELRAAIPGLSDRLLDSRLRELQEEGIVSRSDVGDVVQYSLTAKGRDLRPVFESVSAWAQSHVDATPEVTPGRIKASDTAS